MELLPYSNYTYQNLPKIQEMLKNISSPIGLGMCPSTEYLDEEMSKEELDKVSEVIEDWEYLPKEKVEKISPGSKCAIKYKAWIFNSPLFISSLLKSHKARGVSVLRKKLLNISEAYSESTKVVFNCTGNGSATLAGVLDVKVYPTRGQVVVISAPHITECFLKWDDDSTYIIKRPDSQLNEVILGGFYQKNVSDATTYGYETDDILLRTTKLYPKLLLDNPWGNTISDLQILRVVAGARPSRNGGVRIEKEILDKKRILIHNYGAGGCGYLSGLGMAHAAVSLLDE